MTILPSFAVLDVEGPDAASFLHGQFANDVQALEPDRWRFGSYCQADGRVQAFFVIGRSGNQHFQLLLPLDLADAVHARLTRYRLRARCALVWRPVQITTINAGDRSASAGVVAGAALDWQLSPASAGPVSLPAALFKAQIDQGLPWLDANTSGKFLPQVLALPEFGALSLRKGCFPGQEIVARTHYLGRSKRRLVWADIEGATMALPSGSELALTGSDGACASLLASNWPRDTRCLLVINDALACGTGLHAPDHPEAGSFVIDRDVSDNKRDASLNEGAYTPVGA